MTVITFFLNFSNKIKQMATFNVPNTRLKRLFFTHASYHSKQTAVKINPMAAELTPLRKNCKSGFEFKKVINFKLEKRSNIPGRKIHNADRTPPSIPFIKVPRYPAILNIGPGSKETT